jgi:hypothetical protein
MVKTEWYKNDPRHSIGKRASIIIVDLALNIGCFGDVDTKSAFTVFTGFAEKPMIDANDEWPASWLWAFLPKREEAVDRLPDWGPLP